VEIEILRSNRELVAIDGIMEKWLLDHDDLDNMLADALSHVITGVEGAEVGGIFLQEGKGLVLRGLSGSVEELIDFIADMKSDILLGQAKLHESDRDSQKVWISAPYYAMNELKVW